MNLQEYIKEIGPAKFSELMSISYSVAHNYMTGKHIPSPETARRIKQITHGLIDYEDCYEPYFRDQELTCGGIQLDLTSHI